MKAKFKLTKSSKIYLWIILFLLTLIGLLALSIDTNNIAYKLGNIIGRILSYFIVPYAIAWFVWIITGKKENGGNLMFKLILTLMILTSFSNSINRENNYPESIEVSNSKLKKSILNGESDKSIDSNFDDYQKELFLSITPKLREENKEALKFVKLYMEGQFKAKKIWVKSFKSILDSRVLDYSLLNNPKEYSYQKSIIKKYIKDSKIYKDKVLTTRNELKMMLNENNVNLNTKFMKDLVKSLDQAELKKRVKREKVLNEYIKYGNALFNLLEFLEKNQKDWSYENDELIINNDKLSKRHNFLTSLVSDIELEIKKY